MARAEIRPLENWSAIERKLVVCSAEWVFWDFDGVLCDSATAFRRSVVECCLSFGLVRESGIARKVLMTGRATADVLNDVLGKEHPMRFRLEAELMVRYSNVVDDELEINPLAVDLVRRLRGAGAGQAIVSNGDERDVRALLRRAKLDSLVAFVVTPGSGVRPKPFPDPYLRALELADTSRAVAVEDSAAGLASASAAGVLAFPVRLYE